MISNINRLEDVRPGDIMLGPIGGLVGLGVGLGQLALGEAFRAGRTSIRHAGIVVEASRTEPPSEEWPTGVITKPRLVQAMPHGAEEVGMMYETHWTPRHAYVRLLEDYPGQAEDAAAIARLMVTEGVAYSPASYLALAAYRWGYEAPRLTEWIGRRRPEILDVASHQPVLLARGEPVEVQLPMEAICSVLVDQAWSLAGKRVMVGVAHQAVTPGALANQLWRRPGVLWGFPGQG